MQHSHVPFTGGNGRGAGTRPRSDPACRNSGIDPTGEAGVQQTEVCSDLSNRLVQRSRLGTAIDPMINLCTLNYLLEGIQVCAQLEATRAEWDQLLHYLDKRKFPGYQPNANRRYTYADLKHIVGHLIRPFGIALGSEK